jgi:mediator of RNA polymerase II transcription subunit 17
VQRTFITKDIPKSLSTLDDQLNLQQAEVMERELFRRLLDDCSRLPTASTRVSERRIEVEVLEGVAIKFEMVKAFPQNFYYYPLPTSCRQVDRDSVDVEETGNGSVNESSLIAAILPLLLLRQHAVIRERRLTPPLLGTSSTISRATKEAEDHRASTSILRTVVDAVQYHMFCTRVQEEFNKLQRSLNSLGLECKNRFNRLGLYDGGKELVEKIKDTRQKRSNLSLTGQAMLRMDSR